MDSDDGGADENMERLKCSDLEVQPQEEIGENPHKETEGDDVKRSEESSQLQEPSSKMVDDDDGDGPRQDNSQMTSNDNNVAQPIEPLSGTAAQDKVTTIMPEQEESVEQRRISDVESGEEIVMFEVNSADPFSSSPRDMSLRKTLEDNDLVFDVEQPTTDSSTGEDGSAEDNAVKGSSLVKEDADYHTTVTSESHQTVKDHSREEVDEELEHFFLSAQPRVGKFPGLDNVDLASDEDSHGGAGSKQGGTGVGEPPPNSGDQEKNRDVDADEDEADIAVSMDKNVGEAVHGRSDPKDFPLKYDNYEVCREVEPGVKQCLVLETGEQVVCMVKSKVSSSSSSPPDVQEPFASSSPRCVLNRSNAGSKSNVSPQLPATIINPAEAFAYVSFDGDDKLSSEGGGGQHFRLTENQQAFITENGIPVILDNAEDDVKLDLQAKMDRLGKVVPDQHSPAADEAVGEGSPELMEARENEPVADVLSSGGDGDIGGHLVNASKHVKKMKKKKDKKQRFYELQPDDLADAVDQAEESAALNRSNNSSTSHGNSSRHHEGENCNNNAFDRDRVNDVVYDAREATLSKFRPLYSSLHGDDLSGRRFLTSDVSGSDVTYSPTSRRSATSESHRHFPSRGESSYSRYGGGSPFDSSRLSTRFSYIDRGDPSLESSTQESLTIPRFRTLHDQQVSWLEMFKMIEDQHRNELQSQYSDHQRILQELQQKMESELTRQQDSLKHRLQTHKQILQELSPGRRAHGRDLADSSGIQEGLYQDVSHTTIDGTPVTLKYPPPLSGNFGRAGEERPQSSYSQRHFYDQPVKKIPESELSSSTRPTDTSLNLSEVTVSGEKLLRGGVYSSPMPLAKARHKKTKSGRSCENRSHNSVGERNSHTASSSYGDQAPTSFSEELGQESDDLISPRSRVSLREKHAKHVADLRTYYEEELKEMRKILSSRQTGDDPSRDGGDRILASENAELRQRSQELEDECHDLKIEIRELQQKIQGLEIRACDYADRYDKSQSQVRTLHARLEEVTEFAKEQEVTSDDLKSKNKSLENSLQAVCKKEKELTDSLHATKTTIQRLVEKYESLEKDQHLLKESLADKDEKLFLTRKEAMEANNKLARVELDNKQLLHDKDVLKHELTMARSSVANNVHTSYQDAFQGTAATPSSRSSRNVMSGIKSRSNERSGRSSSYDRNVTRADPLPDSETESEVSKSPIIKAERELKKLRESVGNAQEFAPKLQRKFYGTEASLGHSSLRGSSVSSPGCSASKSKSVLEVAKSSSPKDKKGRRENVNGVKSGSSSYSGGSATAHSGKSLNLHDNNMTKHRESDRIMEIHTPADRVGQGTLKRLGLENGLSGDQALERIKAGEIVSRPAWEDIYTSMAPARSGGPGERTSSSSKANMTKDQLLRERLQTIDMMERKYDDLASEKRKFESALSKVPAHGSRREKERLESELDRLDRDLGSVRMSLKRFHVLKSTI